jgi:hypothetical protein
MLLHALPVGIEATLREMRKESAGPDHGFIQRIAPEHMPELSRLTRNGCGPGSTLVDSEQSAGSTAASKIEYRRLPYLKVCSIYVLSHGAFRLYIYQI